jgi:hypothetical protein
MGIIRLRRGRGLRERDCVIDEGKMGTGSRKRD